MILMNFIKFLKEKYEERKDDLSKDDVKKLDYTK